MRPNPMTALWLLCSCAFLSACHASPPPVLTELRVERVTPPAELLRCQDEPPIPRRPSSQRAVGDVFARVVDAGRDCRSKIDRIRAWAETGDGMPPTP